MLLWKMPLLGKGYSQGREYPGQPFQRRERQRQQGRQAICSSSIFRMRAALMRASSIPAALSRKMTGNTLLPPVSNAKAGSGCATRSGQSGNSGRCQRHRPQRLLRRVWCAIWPASSADGTRCSLMPQDTANLTGRNHNGNDWNASTSLDVA